MPKGFEGICHGKFLPHGAPGQTIHPGDIAVHSTQRPTTEISQKPTMVASANSSTQVSS